VRRCSTRPSKSCWRRAIPRPVRAAGGGDSTAARRGSTAAGRSAATAAACRSAGTDGPPRAAGCRGRRSTGRAERVHHRRVESRTVRSHRALRPADRSVRHARWQGLSTDRSRRAAKGVAGLGIQGRSMIRAGRARVAAAVAALLLGGGCTPPFAQADPSDGLAIKRDLPGVLGRPMGPDRPVVSRRSELDPDVDHHVRVFHVPGMDGTRDERSGLEWGPDVYERSLESHSYRARLGTLLGRHCGSRGAGLYILEELPGPTTHRLGPDPRSERWVRIQQMAQRDHPLRLTPVD
jgi:hypothetical protein